MADVTGPISSLPGSIHAEPEGAKCDNHPERPAVARLQGETDSFGCEMHDLCEECLREDRESARSPEATTGQCEWCRTEATDLRDARDYEEGLHGRVYRVCGPCRKRVEDRDRRELAAYDDGRDEC